MLHRLKYSALGLVIALSSGSTAPHVTVAHYALTAFSTSADADTLEHAACLLGYRAANSYVITGTRPAVVDSARTTRNRIIPRECGGLGVIGHIHSHPAGENCWYYFPTTVVPTADAETAGRSRYALDAILCRDRLVWLLYGREHTQLTPQGD